MSGQDSLSIASTTPRILVVDDNDDNRYTLMLYLDLEGYTDIAIAHDGEEAIARLSEDRFDLVLLDVMMPKIDGYGVLTWLKGQQRLNGLPVIMISALDEIASVVRCIELGAVDYLAKPFNPVLLRARLGASLEKKRLQDEIRAHLTRLEEELEAARRLQMSMLPDAFPPPSSERPAEIFAMMEPARQVGGDLYDFFYIDAARLCFLIGDVSGKGMPAALFMARTKSLIRIVTEFAEAACGGTADAAGIIGRVNRELCQNNSDMMFVTMFFGLLDTRTGALAFCNAGHNPPYRLKKDAVTALDGARGLILGVAPDAVYETGHVALDPGDTLYVFTDGVTEAENAAFEQFAEDRLEAVLRAASGLPSADLVKSVSAALSAFVGTAAASDDITMLAVRVGAA